jgi:hypothetical protein
MNINSWKALPFGPTTTLSYSATFTAVEAELLRRGLPPNQMEDKWFIFWEGDSLFVHRSWTGFGIYQVDPRATANQLEATRAMVAADPSQYRRGTDQGETALLDFLIRAPSRPWQVDSWLGRLPGREFDAA